MNYGRAEAMLERKWPEKYNAVGHLRWNGRLYGKGFWQFLRLNRRRIYHGSWGTALFQSAYSVAPGMLSSILMMPEWYLLIVIFALTSTVSAAYSPLRFSIALLALALFPPAAHAWLCAHRSFFNNALRRRWPLWQLLPVLMLTFHLSRTCRVCCLRWCLCPSSVLTHPPTKPLKLLINMLSLPRNWTCHPVSRCLSALRHDNFVNQMPTHISCSALSHPNSSQLPVNLSIHAPTPWPLT